MALGTYHLIGRHLLLPHTAFLQKRKGFVCLLLEIADVCHKFDWVDHLLVFDEHSSDLASMGLILLLNDWIDNITNFLAALIWLLNCIEFI